VEDRLQPSSSSYGGRCRDHPAATWVDAAAYLLVGEAPPGTESLNGGNGAANFFGEPNGDIKASKR
jgi:hypothetical protein